MIKSAALIYICLVVSFSVFSQGKHKKKEGESCPHYSEDLSSYRNKYVPSADTGNPAEQKKEVKPVNDVTKLVELRIDSIKSNSPKYAQGYRILVYTGSSKDEAAIAKGKARSVTSEHIYTEYRQPNFRVKVGNAFEKLEAQELLIILKKEFPDARIVQDQVNIKTE